VVRQAASCGRRVNWRAKFFRKRAYVLHARRSCRVRSAGEAVCSRRLRCSFRRFMVMYMLAPQTRLCACAGWRLGIQEESEVQKNIEGRPAAV